MSGIALAAGTPLALAILTSLALAWLCALPVHSPTGAGTPNWVDLRTNRVWAIGPRSRMFGSDRWAVTKSMAAAPLRPETWNAAPIPSDLPRIIVRHLSAGQSDGYHVRAVGWPRRCLWGARSGTGSIAMVHVAPQSAWMARRGIQGRMPVGILRDGLMVNVAVFAGVGLAAMVGRQ